MSCEDYNKLHNLYKKKLFCMYIGMVKDNSNILYIKKKRYIPNENLSTKHCLCLSKKTSKLRL